MARTGTRSLSPAVASRRDVPLFLLVLASAFTSVAALLLHAAGWLRMPYAVSFVTLPGMVLLLSLAAWAGRTDRRLLSNRLATGFVAGVLGLVAYDLIRLVVQDALPLHFNAFAVILAFGHFITGQPTHSAASVAAGWAYHISNGLTFAIAFAVVAGPARWWWGLLFGATLQLAMTTIYPGLFEIRSWTGFVVESVVGHTAYGAVLGLWCQRHAMPSRSRWSP
jgi:hypothetical protein